MLVLRNTLNPRRPKNATSSALQLCGALHLLGLGSVCPVPVSASMLGRATFICLIIMSLVLSNIKAFAALTSVAARGKFAKPFPAAAPFHRLLSSRGKYCDCEHTLCSCVNHRVSFCRRIWGAARERSGPAFLCVRCQYCQTSRIRRQAFALLRRDGSVSARVCGRHE
jgi:hypothetical protein